MAYNEHLAERIDRIMKDRKADYYTKKMFGGLCYMVDNKMCCGLIQGELMARINPEIYESSLQKDGVNEMNFTGRPMKGYVFVQESATDMEEDLEFWIDLCLEFNPLAKASKKKKKKA